MRHRVSLQVDEDLVLVGMPPMLLTFIAQKWREAAFIISARIEDDIWDKRQEDLRPPATLNIETRYPIIPRMAISC